jgi:hypothetical protein
LMLKYGSINENEYVDRLPETVIQSIYSKLKSEHPFSLLGLHSSTYSMRTVIKIYTLRETIITESVKRIVEETVMEYHE